MKKIISFILAISLCVCILYTPVFATDGFYDAFTTEILAYDHYNQTSDLAGETSGKSTLNNPTGASGAHPFQSVALGTNGWVNFKVDFGTDGARVINLTYAIADSYAGGTLWVYIDSLSSDPVVTHTVETTGGFNDHAPHEIVMDTPVTGEHIVYVKGSKSATCNFRSLQFEKGFTEITAPTLTLYDSGNNPVSDFSTASKITAGASILNYAPSGINANLVLVPYTNAFKRISPITVDAEININNKTTPAAPTLSKELAGIDSSSVFFTVLFDDDFKPLADSAFYNAPAAATPTRTSEKVLDYYISGTSVTLFGTLADSSTKTLLGIRKEDKAKNAYADYQFIYETAVTDGKYEQTFIMDDDTPTGMYTAIFSSDGGSTDEVDFHYSRPLDIVDAFAEINVSSLPTADDSILTEIDNELDQWKSTLGITEKLDYINGKPEKNWMYTQIHGYLPVADLNALNTAIDKTIFLHKINTTDDDITTAEANKALIGLNEVDYYKEHFATVNKDVLKEKLNTVMTDKLPLTDVAQFNALFREAITLAMMSNHVSWGSIDEAITDFELILNSTYTTSYKALSDEWRKVAASEFLYKDFDSVPEIVTLLESAYNLAIAAKDESESEDNNSYGGGISFGGGGGGGFSVEVPEVKIPEPVEPTPAEPEKEISFADLSGHTWANDAVLYLAESGVISGKSESLYYPADNISREEFVKVLVLAFGALDNNATSNFTDVSSNAWYAPYIATAYNRGWVNGYENGSFGVGESITREQMATMFYRAIVDVDGATNIVNSTVSFTDYGLISSYASESVMSLAKAELMNGVGLGMFQPKRTATRAETAVLVYKYLINR